MTEGYEYETDQLLSEVEGEGGEEEEEPSSSAAQQSLAAVLREDSERGQSAAVGLEGGSGAGSLSAGEGGRDWKPVSLFRTLKKSWFLKELVMVLRLSVPMFLLNFLQQLPIFLTLLFVGQYSGSLELTAASLGGTFVNVTGFSIIVGLSTAADTLCPQSYGYKNYKRVGVIVQRGLLIIGLVCMPVAAVWMNAETILLWLKQLPCVVRLTGQYLRIYILALPGMLCYTMLQKYLQAQSLVWVFVGAGILVNVCLLVCCAVFIVAAQLGIIGASLSVALSINVAPVVVLLYIKCRGLHRQTWGGWSFESLTEWWQFLRLGIPGFLMVAFEWWSFEISAIVVGTINETELAINTVLIQYGVILYLIPYSVAVAVNVRVGNELGAGNILSAKRASFIGVGLQVLDGVLIAGGLLVLRYHVARVFTQEEAVIEGVGDAIPAAFPLILFDQIQAVIAGVLRATGRQAKAALVNFCCDISLNNKNVISFPALQKT